MPVATPTKPAKPVASRSSKAVKPAPPAATLTLSSKNYSSWSLRGWLLTRFAGLAFKEVMVSPDDEDARKELLLLAPSIRVPCLRHEGATVWNTLAIAEYLNETFPKAGLWPADRVARAHARAVCGEMNSGFANLRAALPMNLKGHFPKHKIWAGAKPDIERIVEIWSDCLATYGGPFLFGKKRSAADAIFAPVATRFVTYDVTLPLACAEYCGTVLAMPEMQAWISEARLEPEEIELLDMDF
ncbi:MAG: glutathione S-transferase family protein [Burkholderiales bacterium]|nr:glutathione S-transferase family protein [Burkholderiales bacterium]